MGLAAKTRVKVRVRVRVRIRFRNRVKIRVKVRGLPGSWTRRQAPMCHRDTHRSVPNAAGEEADDQRWLSPLPSAG